MATLFQTRPSGNKFEEEVYTLIQKYTRSVWRNVRVETLLTKQGNTEMDILFCFKNIVFIVEAKNVSAIIGDYGDINWSFIGASSPTKEAAEYTHLNVIVQNNIHVQSFKEFFYASLGEWPTVAALIVVPNNCKVSPALESSIYTLSSLESLLSTFARQDIDSKVGRKVAALIPGDGAILQRPDFITLRGTGTRVKG